MNLYSRGITIVATTKGKGKGKGKEKEVAALRMVDRQLANRNFKSALSLVRRLQRQPSPLLSGFASATQLPRRVSSVEQLHVSMIQRHTLQLLLDAILDSIKTSLDEENSEPGVDNDLYFEDDIAELKQVVQHEAGHFLVGYMLGVLPKQYKVSSTGDHIADASVKFVGFEFLAELEDVELSNRNLHEVKALRQANKRKLSSTVLSKFACVMVGGLVAEHLAFGHSKGHHGDMDKLYGVLKWLEFTEDEANMLTRWASLNTLTILYRHSKAMSALAAAMAQGRSIGGCIHVIESNLSHQVI